MAKSEKTTKATAFRNELVKLMPGYRWTVNHLSRTVFCKDACWITATGIQSSGSNRLSTVEVVRCENATEVSYESQSAGYGVGSRWLTDQPVWGATLAQSLRRLQEYYETQRNTYAGAAAYLQGARQKKEDQGEQGQEKARPPGE